MNDMKPFDDRTRQFSGYERCYTHDLYQFGQSVLKLNARGEEAALLCYDINSMRKINHAYGRRVGDGVLRAVADYVADATQGSVYKIEGDLYCAVVPRCTLAGAVALAHMVEKRFEKPWKVVLSDREVTLVIKLTLAVVEVNPDAYEGSYLDIFERALEYSRKSKTVTLFDSKAERLSWEQVRLQMDLKSCIMQDMLGFDVFFQPIADPAYGTWRGVEALCRWNRPGHGPVAPYKFIREAEEMGYIHNIGAWVLETAVKVCKRLELHRLDSFFVTVNVSALQIIRGDFAKTVLETVARNDYPCGKLLLEITESNEFVINDDTRGTIDLLRERGIQFALDDFGTGYSSFSSLKNMPVDYLKTERDFIRNIEQDSYLQYFLFVLSEVAHTHGMRLIAEGVETQEQLGCVMRAGADLVQGYYFGKPLNRDDLARNLHRFYQSSGKQHSANYTDFQRWISSKDAYTVTPALFTLQMRCMDVILNTDTLEDSVNKVLEMIGSHFKVKRAYIFLCDGGTIFSNRYEWCAPGVESQIHILQGIDGSTDGFYDVLVKNKVFITSTRTQLPDNLTSRLKAGGQEGSVQSMVVMPLSRQDEVIGFVGFDDDYARHWTPEEMIMLHGLCLLVLIILGRHLLPPAGQ